MSTYPKTSVIASYSLEGKLQKTYRSAKDASLDLGVYIRSVDKAMRQSTSLKGFIFKR